VLKPQEQQMGDGHVPTYQQHFTPVWRLFQEGSNMALVRRVGTRIHDTP
jgi:hypothetical protein